MTESTYTPELAAVICERLAEGQSLRSICQDKAMPSEKTVRGWARDNVDGFSARYEQARFVAYMAMFDEILEIADERCADMVESQRNRLRVDTRKWALAKALPKVFGDKIDVDARLTDAKGELLSGFELTRTLAFILASGARENGKLGASPSTGEMLTTLVNAKGDPQ